MFCSFGATFLFFLLTKATGATDIAARTASAPQVSLYPAFAGPGILLAAANEELLTRGYVLKTLESHGHPVYAVVATSAAFSLIHLTNQNLSFLALLDIFLIGCLLAMISIAYDSPWLPFGLNAGWNFRLNLLNFPISGQTYPNPLFQTPVS